jgi:hypothetical protein
MRSLASLPLRLLLLALVVAGALTASADAASAEYATVHATEFGKVLATERSTAQTLRAALQQTLADLTRYFGSPPSVFSAFADSKDPHAGGATFLVTAKGVKFKGLVKCQLGTSATRVVVIFIRADATGAQWQALVQPPPESPAEATGSGGTTAAESTAVAKGPLSAYNFPDGTGSIGLAAGWTTNAQTATRVVLLQGPKDQSVALGGLYTVVTPASTLPHIPGELRGSYGSPLDVFATLVPQFSALSAKQGGPTRTVDHLVRVDDPKHVLASAQITVLRYGVTETAPGGSSKHYQGMTWMGVGPVRNGTFFVSLSGMRAPDATFEKDKPVMFEMLTSLKTNDAVVQRKASKELAAQNQRFEAQQRAMRAQQAANDAQHQQFWDSQREKARSNDNFDEYIRGVRTVEDTQTGVKTSVDLGNVTKIVDDLNAHDPGRYREIPLRDEVNP